MYIQKACLKTLTCKAVALGVKGYPLVAKTPPNNTFQKPVDLIHKYSFNISPSPHFSQMAAPRPLPRRNSESTIVLRKNTRKVFFYNSTRLNSLREGVVSILCFIHINP